MKCKECGTEMVRAGDALFYHNPLEAAARACERYETVAVVDGGKGLSQEDVWVSMARSLESINENLLRLVEAQEYRAGITSHLRDLFKSVEEKHDHE